MTPTLEQAQGGSSPIDRHPELTPTRSKRNWAAFYTFAATLYVIDSALLRRVDRTHLRHIVGIPDFVVGWIVTYVTAIPLPVAVALALVGGLFVLHYQLRAKRQAGTVPADGLGEKRRQFEAFQTRLDERGRR